MFIYSATIPEHKMQPFHRSSALRIEYLDGILRSAENEADKWFSTCSIAGEEERNVSLLGER